MAANAVDHQLTELEAFRYRFGRHEAARVVKLLKRLAAEETWGFVVLRVGTYEISVKHGRGREEIPLGQGLTRSGNTKATVACP